MNTKPKCTIYKDWRGPECGEDAVSMNDYGGFQCLFHDGIPECKDNNPVPFSSINKEDLDAVEKLQQAYDLHLETSSIGHTVDEFTIVNEAYTVPKNMKRHR
jgi:hypothetical protein